MANSNVIKLEDSQESVIKDYLLLKKSNGKFGRKFMVLENSDLFCYKKRDCKKLLFVHSLVGAFIDDITSTELVEGAMYFKLKIFLSKRVKRVLYFVTEELRAKWY